MFVCSYFVYLSWSNSSATGPELAPKSPIPELSKKRSVSPPSNTASLTTKGKGKATVEVQNTKVQDALVESESDAEVSGSENGEEEVELDEEGEEIVVGKSSSTKTCVPYFNHVLKY